MAANEVRATREEQFIKLTGKSWTMQKAHHLIQFAEPQFI